jgi:hypothetical protein
MSYDEALNDTIWSHWYESQRMESAVRRLLASAEKCEAELEQTRRGVSETQQDAPPAAVSRMIPTVKRFLTFAALVGLASQADAGVFRRTKVTAVCTTAACQTQQTMQAPAAPAAAGNTSTAQGVALLIVQTGRFRHFGGYGGYEGIGMGATPAQAEANCCYRNRWSPRERGFAQLANGMWICCCRY